MDTTRWPLVTTAPTPAIDDPEALAETYRLYEAVLARNEPFALLFDLRGYKSDPIRRRRFAEWYHSNAFSIRTNCAGCAAVVSNSLEAGIVTAYTWLFGAPVPLKSTSSLQAAEAWLREQLLQKGQRAR